MHNNLIAAAIGVTVGVLSAASIFIYRKILSNQQYATTISDLDCANKRIEELQAELETLRLQLKQKKKRRHLRKFNSNDSTYTLTDNDTDVDVFSTDTDVGDDEFYDCSDGESVSSENDMRISEELHQLDTILKEIDDQVNEEFDIKTYYKLQALVKYDQDNVELVWRFARTCYDYAVVQTDQNTKRKIILQGIELCERILENRHAELFKWYAILIGLNGNYLSTADKIKNGVIFKNYVIMALEMRPNDFELHYLLGRFKYEIASLNWLEKKQINNGPTQHPTQCVLGGEWGGRGEVQRSPSSKIEGKPEKIFQEEVVNIECWKAVVQSEPTHDNTYSVMRGYLCGILYCTLWYGSVVAGFLFIACPLLPLLLFSPQTFRKCGDLLLSCWELYSTALLKLFGVKILVSGDHISPDESAILIMNHRTRVDWNFLWAAMYQACLPSVVTHRLKFVLKDPIRHIPGPGWIMQMNGFLYITRRWEEDQSRLSRTLDYFVALNRRSQVLIFPEGTDFTKSSKEKSDKYAQQHVLPHYFFTLHPKTTGFTYLVRHLQQARFFDAVYDLTIAYPDYIPQSELDLIKGKFPNEVHFHIKRIPSSEVPTHELTLRRWLEERWFNKEEVLKQFYEKKSFNAEIWPFIRLRPLQLAFGFWTILMGIAVVLLITSRIFQIWALLHTAFFVGLSIFTTGFNQLEIGWYWRWRMHFCQKKYR